MKTKTKSTKRLPDRVWRFGVGGALLAAGTMIDHLTMAGPYNGSSVIADQAPQPPLQTQDQQSQTNVLDVFTPGGQAAQNAAPPLPQLFRYGPIQLHPHLDYRFSFGSGIQSSPGNTANMIVQQVSPGLLIDLGKHFTLDYTPTLTFYSNREFQNSVDHNIALTAGFESAAWKFGISHSTAISSDPLVETGEQTDQTIHMTSLTATHDFNDRFSTDLALNQNISLVSGFEDSYDWSTMDWINYKIQPHLTTGLGVGVGYVKVDSSNPMNGNENLDQTYEQVQARLDWRITKKLSLQLTGGFEDRQFMTANTGDSLSPIFSAALQYEPIKGTQISLTASRTENTSDYYTQAQETTITSVNLDINQRLFRKFNLEAGVGYSLTDYKTASGPGATNVDRDDNGVTFNVKLSHPFFRRGMWAVFYQYGESDSSVSGFNYQSNQVGVEFGYKF